MSGSPQPRLSVLVPTFNYADFIRQAIQSVLEQNVPGVEVVVADDGSTDGTAEVLADWIRDGRVRYFCQENGGPSSARNLAMREARGEYLMFLDADDFLVPGCIEETLGFLDRHPEVGFFFTNYDIFDELGEVAESGVDTWSCFRSIPHDVVGPDEWIFRGSLAPAIVEHGSFMHTSGLTVRQDCANDAGPFRDGYFYGEDDEFCVRVTRHCKAGYLDRLLSRKRNHAGSIIHDPSKRLRNMQHLLALTEIQLAEFGEDPELKALLHEKCRIALSSYGWHLLEDGRYEEVRALVRRYVSRYPFFPPIYKLFVRSYLNGRHP